MLHARYLSTTCGPKLQINEDTESISITQFIGPKTKRAAIRYYYNAFFLIFVLPPL